jgi:hypothetical protein
MIERLVARVAVIYSGNLLYTYAAQHRQTSRSYARPLFPAKSLLHLATQATFLFSMVGS